MRNFRIREAERSDVPLILRFIVQLAEYEKMKDQVTATEDLIENWIFDKKKAEAVIGERQGEPVGFALFFHNFSTFLGRAGIYIEDLYVVPEARGLGFGKALVRYIAELCVKRGCGRLEWSCLDWNQSSIDFYLSLGAVPLSDWTKYRIAGETLRALSEAK
jgi:GNAT superfamily N-acetyltransferase